MGNELVLFPVFLDKMGERMAFERISVGLFDALARKRRLLPPGTSIPLATLERFQEEELAHIRLLERCIRLLGGNVAAQSASAGIIATASMGFQKIVLDSHVSFLSSLEAMLIAEQIDTVGWELLIMLTQKTGLEELAWEFRGALDEERKHLKTLQEWVAELTVLESSARTWVA